MDMPLKNSSSSTGSLLVWSMLAGVVTKLPEINEIPQNGTVNDGMNLFMNLKETLRSPKIGSLSSLGLESFGFGFHEKSWSQNQTVPRGCQKSKPFFVGVVLWQGQGSHFRKLQAWPFGLNGQILWKVYCVTFCDKVASCEASKAVKNIDPLQQT